MGPVEDRKTWYFSSPHQFEQLLAVLDKTEFEKSLCQELYNLRPEILRQMAITVQLTNELKGILICQMETYKFD